jgi:hypothetical protein
MTKRKAITHIQELQWFESMYTLQEKPDTHDTYASYASPRMTYARFLQAVPIHYNLSH